MSEIITVNNLYRSFKEGKKTIPVLNNVNFSVYEGEVFGILGPNGAGKTTLIKILSTILSPTEGNVSILNYDVEKDAKIIRENINFVYGGEKGVYGRLTAKEYLVYFCHLYKIEKNRIPNLVKNLMGKVNIDQYQDRKINSFSKGMIERVHLARSLINDPKIIFLDEPTVGLDPDGARLLKKIILNIQSEGKTIIFTTHYMQEADDLCNRIAFLENGIFNKIAHPEVLKTEAAKKTGKYLLYFEKKHLKCINEVVKKNEIEIVKQSEIGNFIYLTFFNKVYELDVLSKMKHLAITCEEKNLTLEDVYMLNFSRKRDRI
ncbi:ABC transporter ATP-binding protein [Enterococcus ureasiticus]|uniref:ABC transporter domain-containing protein n=1 Tax=Enterococcus ureasiticus TaxID=903984 RepID=A0A1E5GCG4_9ENTE|nr:ABC transporter ATP-binding protein [Enterococcus ureasiticus]OEG10341.1 hypothetical protein BCR21_13410 [Enterococcus ureasiticus]